MIVGYAGGKEANPTYKNILDHTEAIRIHFNPKILSFYQIIESFFEQCHPFGPSYSRQYRLAILYYTEEQRSIAQAAVDRLSSDHGGRKVYVDIEPATDFYRAEEYHQKYIQKNGGADW